MNKPAAESNTEKLNRVNFKANNYLNNDGTSSNSSDESDYEEEDEEETTEFQQIKSLFSENAFFKSAKDLFKHEAEVNDFNLINIVNSYSMNMFDYIKMVNFIRKEASEQIEFYKQRTVPIFRCRVSKKT